ncbi:hypothetical protein D187_001618 [Cystobacter fuscus DSM 2262]|uniref:Uncharacterized protein n=1 Tax=Cystobacter fuscus (strain ATCC 25194 / DSM 2262 / NBRC 100088 / M29) TaxID=1242864 RepID=S9PCZ8_CYSF2|nr:hypothetical protein D187_001618 [Cystobacter fuscus DSM 2262]
MGATNSPVLALTGVVQAAPQDWLNREYPLPSGPLQDCWGWMRTATVEQEKQKDTVAAVARRSHVGSPFREQVGPSRGKNTVHPSSAYPR